jgi:transglutaminase-like putative cysteine protease
MRRAGVVLSVAVAACVPVRPPARSGPIDYPTLEPDDRPIDPYAEAAAEAPPAFGAWEDGEYRQQVIRVETDIGDPRVVEAMVVRIRTRSFRVPEAPNQKVTVGDDGIQRVTIEVGPGAKVTAAERKAALEATFAYDAEHELVTEIARHAVGDERDPAKRVAALVAWMDTHISYEISDEYVASTVLRNGKGDCSEQAMLFVALARAAKVPARHALGLVPTLTKDGDVAFGYHSWAEVALDGHWVRVDPTWNEPVADATHITLSVADENEISADEMDALSLTVAELTKGPGGVDDPLALARDLPVHLTLNHR